MPDEIQKVILGGRVFNKSIPEMVIQLRETRLLEVCLNVYCGYPQPLWYNGYHHSRTKVWNCIMEQILLEDVVDKSFEISLREFIDSEYNDDKQFVKQNDKIWANITSDKRKKKLTLDRLIQVSATQVQTNKEMWLRFIESCNDEEKVKVYNRIIEFIEPIESKQHSIFDLFDKELFMKFIYPLAESDFVIFNMCEYILKLHKGTLKFIMEDAQEKELEEERRIFEQAIQIFYEQKPPRLQLTNQIVKNVAKEIQMSSKKLDDLLNKKGCELTKQAREKQKQLDDEYELVKWNF